jgi:hypothetical protein
MQTKGRKRRQQLIWFSALLAAGLLIGHGFLSAQQKPAAVPLFQPSESVSADKAVSFPTDI